MNIWSMCLVHADQPIREAIAVIENSTRNIALVINSDQLLLGTVTDGDVRRGLLRGLGLDAPVGEVMNTAPHTVPPDFDDDQILRFLVAHNLRFVPVVDGGRRVVGLRSHDELTVQRRKSGNWVVLMAGGLGTRLHPLTQETPKPMLKIGNKPILETILDRFMVHDFHRFYISVNYKADIIRAHFGDGSRWGAEIRYLDETTRMGTAGALSLIDGRPEEPLVVMNGDVLTNVNFRGLMDFHAAHGAAATMAVREYDFQVPFGVVEVDGPRICGISEKPVQSFYINAGIYVIEPDVLDLLEKGESLDMPTLFERLMAAGRRTVAFPIHDYWIDVGRMDDFVRANGEFHENFG